MILKTFTTYFAIKMITTQLPIDLWFYTDFFLWNLFLVVPAMAAIFMGALTISQWKKLCNEMGKYSNYCVDDGTLLKVRLNNIK